MQIIAERRLVAVASRKNEQTALVVRVGAAVSDELLKCFRNKVQFSGPIEETHEIAGVDSVDSLRLALDFIDKRIKEVGRTMELRWDDQSPYLK